MKAIETSYRGYRFRSRLEARWAVFFDTLVIEWEYEPQGFIVAGEPYLPDFYLPRFHGGIYAEVKPTEQADFGKCVQFANEGGKILCLAGMPSNGSYSLLGCQFGETDWVTTSVCFHIKYLQSGRNSAEYRLYVWPESRDGEHDPWGIDFAISAARSARFEHGQIGALY